MEEVKTLKAELEAEKTAHGTTKTGYETEKTNATLMEKIHQAAIAEGKLEGVGIAALKKHGLDMSKVKHKGGEITNMSEIMEEYKTDSVIGALWGGEKTTTGAEAGAPSPNNSNDKNTLYKSRLDEARKNNNTLEAVKIKTEAAADGVILI